METMDLEFEPETRFERAGLRFSYLMQKVATLIMIRRRNEGNTTTTDPWKSVTRAEWSDVVIKLNSFEREDFVPAIAEVRKISTKAAEAEYDRMIADTFVPQTELEHAWVDSLAVLNEVLKIIMAHRDERREDERLDALLFKAEGQKNQGMTDPGEAAIEDEKLAMLNTKTRAMAPSKGNAAAVKKLKDKAKARKATEAGAVERMNKEEIRLDKLLPESYVDW